MDRSIYIGLLLLLALPKTFGQGVIADQSKTLFSNEKSFGIFLNSNGYGADYRFGRYVDIRNHWIYEVNFDYVKDPKEYKSIVAYNYYTRRFVYGKQNLFWELKGYAGRQHELFTKSDESSISIRLFYMGGLSLGFEKPVYYQILTFNTTGEVEKIDEKKFDRAIHVSNYGGTASVLKGFNEMRIVPGLTVKAGLSFEYSEREPTIHALETGIGLSAYPVSINIMDTDKKNYLFFQMYLGYRFGTIIDISDAARAKSLKERRLERKGLIQNLDQLPE